MGTGLRKRGPELAVPLYYNVCAEPIRIKAPQSHSTSHIKRLILSADVSQNYGLDLS